MLLCYRLASHDLHRTWQKSHDVLRTPLARACAAFGMTCASCPQADHGGSSNAYTSLEVRARAALPGARSWPHRALSPPAGACRVAALASPASPLQETPEAMGWH